MWPLRVNTGHTPFREALGVCEARVLADVRPLSGKGTGVTPARMCDRWFDAAVEFRVNLLFGMATGWTPYPMWEGVSESAVVESVAGLRGTSGGRHGRRRRLG